MPEGTQQIAALRRKGDRRPCPRAGCERYEKGWQVVLNMADPADANVARFIREGKTMRRYEEMAADGLEGVITFRFHAGQPCLGHLAGGWEEPVYVVGDRKTDHDEWHYRYEEGALALIAATTRLREMED